MSVVHAPDKAHPFCLLFFKYESLFFGEYIFICNCVVMYDKSSKHAIVRASMRAASVHNGTVEAIQYATHSQERDTIFKFGASGSVLSG